MSETVRSSISSWCSSFLNPTPKRAIVAFSGGPDSVCLVDCLEKHYPELSLILVHFDHGLRGESKNDSEWVQDFASKRGMEVVVEAIPVADLASEKKWSLESSGRYLRYQKLEQFLVDFDVTHCFLGHHQDDCIETFLFRIIKGSKRGAQSIQPFVPFRSNTFLCRPLLDCYKEDILEYCHENQLPYLKDESNQDLSFDRNHIRHHLEAFAGPINASYKKQLSSFITYQSEINAYIDHQSKWAHIPKLINEHYAWFDLSGVPDNRFITSWLVAHMFRNIKDSLLDLDFTYDEKHVKALSQHIENNIVEVYQCPRDVFCQVIDRVVFFSFPKPMDPIKLEIGHNIIEPLGIDVLIQVIPPQQSYTSTQKKAYMAVDTLDVDIVLRSGGKGDTFQLFNSDSEKSLLTCMSKLKVPRVLRSRLPLFFLDNHLAWITEYQVSGKFKISQKTTSILCIEIKDIK